MSLPIIVASVLLFMFLVPPASPVFSFFSRIFFKSELHYVYILLISRLIVFLILYFLILSFFLYLFLAFSLSPRFLSLHLSLKFKSFEANSPKPVSLPDNNNNNNKDNKKYIYIKKNVRETRSGSSLDIFSLDIKLRPNNLFY